MGEEGAAPAVAAAVTTLSGATMIGMNPWLTAAVVAAYGTKALWGKLRRMASATRNQKLLKYQDEPQKLQQDGNESEDTEAESADEYEGLPDLEQDKMLKHFESDAGPMNRSIKL